VNSGTNRQIPAILGSAEPAGIQSGVNAAGE
jgi:hypothetical protein